MSPEKQEVSVVLIDRPHTEVSETTQVHHRDDGASFIICNSKKPFVNPTQPVGKKPEDVLKELNLDLGQTLINPQNKTLLWVIKFLDNLCFQWWESLFFKLWKKVPLAVRRALTFGSWKIYLRLHKLILGRRTGIHPSQSEEYHALTTIMWWGRFFPISPERMRFALSQLYVCTPNTVQAHFVENIEHKMPLSEDDFCIPPYQSKDTTVRGLFLHQHKRPTEYAIFWVYGGAYLAGDCLGNSSSADWIGKHTDMDVFIPEFRLAPECDIHDVLWDAALAYKWMISKRDPSKIFMVGVSSGGAICIRLMQFIAEQQRDKTTLPDYIPKLGTQPKGAVLFGPYIDYTREKKGSFLYYPRLDLIVNESVQKYGLPYLDSFIPGGRRRDNSPVYQSMEGLPPLCVIVSEHESVYDMTMEMVNKARNEGVPVSVGVWKYMCHVFSFLWGFVPESKQSMEFVCNWLQEKSK